MVLLEAMSVGLPVISFSCQCGPRDVIKHNHTGVLVEEGDVEGLAQAILKVIEDENFRKDLGHNAYIEADNYDMDRIMGRWVRFSL